MNWNNETVIAALSYPGDNLPEDALHEAINRYDDLKAALHAALALSLDEVIALNNEDDDEYRLQFFAMYLAAEKRDADAFPLIRDFFAQYGQAAEDLSGEMVCEHLDRILASVCQNAEALKSAAELPDLSTWARCACFDALGILFHQGYLERATLIDWFKPWLEQDELDMDMRTSIAFTCCELGIHELESLLLTSLKNGRFDPDSMDAEYIKESTRRKQVEAYKLCWYELVDDAIDLLHFWYPDEVPDIYSALYDPDELMVIQALLQEYNDKHDDAPLELEFFHGYVYAVVLTPEPLSANEWIPEIFGDEMPAFDSIDEANAKLAVLMQFYNRLNQLRLEGMLHCPFRLEDRHHTWWLNSVREWSRGFVLGMSLRWEYWTLPDADSKAEEVNAAMLVVSAIADDAVVAEIFGTQDNGDRSKEGNEFLARAILTLPDAIRTLAEHTQAQDATRVINLPVRSTKVGRNAPCPCGSGKKFKKCCGGPGRPVH